MNITDLPVGISTHVASFLPKPSRALFAISLTSPSSSWQNTSEEKQLSETSKAIMSPSSQWEVLDFEEVEKSLTIKLRDNDLYAILTCIKHTVKILKLTGCINIIGRGLTPLQFSTALELIDLSLLKQHEDSSTRLYVGSRICQDTVIPILGSIISVQGCSLKYLHFPREWTRGAWSTTLVDFKDRYMEHLVRLGISCSKCNNIIRGRAPRRHTNGIGIRFCCYSCLKPICVTCDEPGDSLICGICKKVYCSGCSRVDQRNRCTQCNHTICGGCKHNHMSRCSGCDARRCNNCLRISGPLCRNCIEDDNDDLDWF